MVVYELSAVLIHEGGRVERKLYSDLDFAKEIGGRYGNSTSELPARWINVGNHVWHLFRENGNNPLRFLNITIEEREVL